MNRDRPTPPSPPPRRSRPLLALGIETSCDETAAAIVRRNADGSGVILSNVVRSQWAEHGPYGGVVPEIAARAHVQCLGPITREALAAADLSLDDIDLVAATAGPGLIGGLLVGLTFAKALALSVGKPFIAVNHLEAHALTVGLTNALAPPYLMLLVSGGHTQAVLVEAVGRYRRLGSTIDDALGEAFDKTAKILGLGYPGGPAVELAARTGDPSRFDLPRPLMGRPEPNFSFAGLKTAVRRTAQRLAAVMEPDAPPAAPSEAMSGSNRDPALRAAPAEAQADAFASAGARREREETSGSNRDPALRAAPAEAQADAFASADTRREREETSGSNRDPALRAAPAEAQADAFASAGARRELKETDISDLCASFEAAVAETVVDRCRRAFEIATHLVPGGTLPLVVSGGVAANIRLREALAAFAESCGTRAVFPPPGLCTDNGAMIAWAGAERFAAGHSDDLAFEARARWPLDEAAAPVLGGGKNGAKA